MRAIESSISASPLHAPCFPSPQSMQKPPRPPRDDVDHRILELNAAGHGDNQISKLIGMSQTTVSGRRRAMGVESPTPKGGRRR